MRWRGFALTNLLGATSVCPFSCCSRHQPEAEHYQTRFLTKYPGWDKCSLKYLSWRDTRRYISITISSPYVRTRAPTTQR
ncbi:hypothetical protein F5883DRAFT_533797 [Diaporthe sp. PMI_573]|nr:hypothetical protein F5883DRAFT_533797 [Diaporthaceae sp. PMI_573]